MVWNATANPGAIIEGDMLEGLPTLGTDTGTFLGNIAPGIGKFILILAVFGGVGAIIYAVIHLVKKRVSK